MRAILPKHLKDMGIFFSLHVEAVVADEAVLQCV